MQVIQEARHGRISLLRTPLPAALPGRVILAAAASVVSAGTERYVVELARKSMLGKALQRPDHVRRLWQKVSREGIRSALTQLSAKLDEPMELGYSAAGVVLACGANVQEFKPGDRVAAAAPHGSVLSVGRNLCAAIPDGVPFDCAAYAGIASIALQGVRLAKLSLGERVLVIGLGLIGQICVCLLKAQGCLVFGVDIDPRKLDLARDLGADAVACGFGPETVRAFAGALGVDAAILTVATTSNEPIAFAAEQCRHKGRIVLIGVAGLRLPREPFFRKELEFTVSSSLGPGRGDPAYEDKGLDYPAGYARWTAQRNMQAVLELMAAGKLPVQRLTTHRFPVERAAAAYDLITAGKELHVGVVIEYSPESQPVPRRFDLQSPPARNGRLGISLIGSGNFARLVLIPALTKIPGLCFRGICSAKGLSAAHSAENGGFQFCATDPAEVWNDRESDIVFIATRHHLHAEFVIACLQAGKHVFVEKPLCIDAGQLTAIANCVEGLGDRCPVLMVGFNRRFTAGARRIAGFFANNAPLSVSYRFAPGYLPPDHWTQDAEIGGGRIVGEACHAIDLCVALTNSVPVRVFAESVAQTGGIETSDDRVFITLRHANGSVSNVSYQAGGDRAAPPERLEAFGGGRTAIMDSPRAIELWAGNRRRTARGSADKGHACEFAAFLAACREGGPWPISWEHLQGVAWSAIAAVQSLRTGLPVGAGGEDLDDAAQL